MPAHPKTPHLFVVEDRGYATPCHVWTRATNSDGYGVRKVAGRVLLAHRHAYETEIGPIPAGLQLDHLCEVRPCVNPEHLEPVTSTENTRRGSATKLSIASVEEIRVRRAAGEHAVDLGVEYGVHASMISRIALGQVWAA